jgi:hypothetical protein
MSLTSKEFYINMTDIPTKDSRDYLSFYANETEKIKYGLNINGTYIHGWLYWHLNMWKIYLDELDKRDNSIYRKFTNPQLRDNEWMLAQYLKEAEDSKKGLTVVGARRLGKSVMMSSYIARMATIYKGSENVIVGNNKDDLGVITSLTEKGLTALPDYYKFGRINDDWSKEVTLGFKDRKNNRDEWSKIFIRNTNNGNLTEVVAGTTPKSLIFDEIGKASFNEVFSAAIPSFSSPYGWRATPLCFGTGGDFENGNDAKTMFEDPDTYNMVSMTLPEEGNKKTCIFIPGTMSLEFPKNEMSFSQFLNVDKGTELDDIPIFVSDIKKNKEIIKEKRKVLEKAKDGKELLKYKMYFPLTSDECFLTDTQNNFPIEQTKIALDMIMRKPELQGQAVTLHRDKTTNKIFQKDTSNSSIIWEYPHDIKRTNLNAPIVIYEKPMENPPLYLYIAGIDPYNQENSSYSDSLGVCYIYKRMYDPVGGTFQQRIVASYAARPDTMKEWNENVELLLEYYNAIAMMENEGTTLLSFLDNKNKAYLLADGFSLLKEISPNTKIMGRNKGLPATIAVINHCMSLFVEYSKEEILLGYDEEGKAMSALGVSRISDPLLLKEILAYKKGANVDRICAFRHILAFDKYLEKSHAIVNVKKTQDVSIDEFIKNTPRSPFGYGKTPFPKKIQSPFK